MAKSSFTVDEIIGELEKRAPSQTAEEWDNVGLLVGDPAWKTSGVVVSVDLTEKAIQVAKSKGYRLIVTHHPCIFPKSRGLSKITPSSLAFRAIREGIAVASYHTNFDQCALEVVDRVCEGLQIEPKGRLLDETRGSLMKLVVFVPTTHLEQVRSAICEAGAGTIGDYDFCTFAGLGEGTFRGGRDTRPFLGRPGKLEKAQEAKLETIFPKGLEARILSALMNAHPYEEVAYDLYPVAQGPSPAGIVEGLGYGFWGEFPSSKAFSEVVRNVTRLFSVNGFLLTEPSPSRVRRIGFVAGKGASFLKAASSVRCDLFITGEVGYHVALDGVRRGVAVMELGHRESEKFFPEIMAQWLSRKGLRSVCIQVPTQKIWAGGKK